MVVCLDPLFPSKATYSSGYEGALELVDQFSLLHMLWDFPRRFESCSRRSDSFLFLLSRGNRIDPEPVLLAAGDSS